MKDEINIFDKHVYVQGKINGRSFRYKKGLLPPFTMYDFFLDGQKVDVEEVRIFGGLMEVLLEHEKRESKVRAIHGYKALEETDDY